MTAESVLPLSDELAVWTLEGTEQRSERLLRRRSHCQAVLVMMNSLHLSVNTGIIELYDLFL